MSDRSIVILCCDAGVLDTAQISAELYSSLWNVLPSVGRMWDLDFVGLLVEAMDWWWGRLAFTSWDM
jgi:hypothetical protein